MFTLNGHSGKRKRASKLAAKRPKPPSVEASRRGGVDAHVRTCRGVESASNEDATVTVHGDQTQYQMEIRHMLDAALHNNISVTLLYEVGQRSTGVL